MVPVRPNRLLQITFSDFTHALASILLSYVIVIISHVAGDRNHTLIKFLNLVQLKVFAGLVILNRLTKLSIIEVFSLDLNELGKVLVLVQFFLRSACVQMSINNQRLRCDQKI